MYISIAAFICIVKWTSMHVLPSSTVNHIEDECQWYVVHTVYSVLEPKLLCIFYFMNCIILCICDYTCACVYVISLSVRYSHIPSIMHNSDTWHPMRQCIMMLLGNTYWLNDKIWFMPMLGYKYDLTQSCSLIIQETSNYENQFSKDTFPSMLSSFDSCSISINNLTYKDSKYIGIIRWFIYIDNPRHLW